jgi:hypothetical protein
MPLEGLAVRICAVQHCTAITWRSKADYLQSKATGRTSEESRFDSRPEQEIYILSKPSGPTLGPTQRPTQWLTAAPGSGRRDTDHSPPPNAEVKKEQIPPYAFMACTGTSPVLFIWEVNRPNILTQLQLLCPFVLFVKCARLRKMFRIKVLHLRCGLVCP